MKTDDILTSNFITQIEIITNEENCEAITFKYVNYFGFFCHPHISE